MEENITVGTLVSYSDSRGNQIDSGGVEAEQVQITFAGSNNRVTIAGGASIGRLILQFDASNAHFELGASTEGSISIFGRLGEESTIALGANVSSTGMCVLSANQGCSIRVGESSVLAAESEIHCEEDAAIFDVTSGDRVNPSRSVVLGKNVLLAERAIVLRGSTIGDGAIVNPDALVEGDVPANSLAAGSPARVVRQGVAWRRPTHPINIERHVLVDDLDIMSERADR